MQLETGRITTEEILSGSISKSTQKTLNEVIGLLHLSEVQQKLIDSQIHRVRIICENYMNQFSIIQSSCDRFIKKLEEYGHQLEYSQKDGHSDTVREKIIEVIQQLRNAYQANSNTLDLLQEFLEEQSHFLIKHGKKSFVLGTRRIIFEKKRRLFSINEKMNKIIQLLGETKVSI